MKKLLCALLAAVLTLTLMIPCTATDFAGFSDQQEIENNNAVRMLYDLGLISGYSDGSFGPDDAITREQFAVMLYNYAVWSGMDAVTLRENLTGFVDSESVSPYAVQALNWAVGEGIINGKGNQILDPKGQATRAQAAAMLQRFLED